LVSKPIYYTQSTFLPTSREGGPGARRPTFQRLTLLETLLEFLPSLAVEKVLHRHAEMVVHSKGFVHLPETEQMKNVRPSSSSSSRPARESTNL
jgi:hypothetical protein